jgi:hypothetical protein
MAGRKRRQTVAIPVERIAKRKFVDQAVAAESTTVETSGRGRAERQFMGGQMVKMGMGNEPTRLALASVDG